MTFLGSARASRAGIGALANANFFSIGAPGFFLWLCGLQLLCFGKVSAKAPKTDTRGRVCSPDCAAATYERPE